jgi:hypothetical protein
VFAVYLLTYGTWPFDTLFSTRANVTGAILATPIAPKKENEKAAMLAALQKVR